MIYIGLTSWTEHHSLMPSKKKLELSDYAGFFPCVENDSTFYGLKNQEVAQKWLAQVPDTFRFICKVPKAFTKHDREQELQPGAIENFCENLRPMLENDQLECLLLQFPPYFDCTTQNVQYLKWLVARLKPYPCAVEFRHDSWWTDVMRDKTLAFLKNNQLTHVVVDEPAIPGSKVPFIPVVTSQIAYVRLHGRNAEGWQKQDSDWRKNRTNYDYSNLELSQIAEHVLRLSTQAKDVFVIFNNNSGGHAAQNAKSLQQILKIEYQNLAPRQIDLF